MALNKKLSELELPISHISFGCMVNLQFYGAWFETWDLQSTIKSKSE